MCYCPSGGQKALRFHQKYLICGLKMNVGLTGVEWQKFNSGVNYPFGIQFILLLFKIWIANFSGFPPKILNVSRHWIEHSVLWFHKCFSSTHNFHIKAGFRSDLWLHITSSLPAAWLWGVNVIVCVYVNVGRSFSGNPVRQFLCWYGPGSVGRKI